MFNQYKPNINPYTNRPSKMTRMQIFLWPEEKAKLFTEAKKAKYNGSVSSVVRGLIKKVK